MSEIMNITFEIVILRFYTRNFKLNFTDLIFFILELFFFLLCSTVFDVKVIWVDYEVYLILLIFSPA